MLKKSSKTVKKKYYDVEIVTNQGTRAKYHNLNRKSFISLNRILKNEDRFLRIFNKKGDFVGTSSIYKGKLDRRDFVKLAVSRKMFK